MELKNVTFLVIGELYLAINTNLEKVFLLDNITFDVLKAIKDQYDMKNIEMQYGTEIVDKVIKNWQEFQRKGERKNRGQNDTEYIEFIADENRSKELVEGVFLVSQSCNMKCCYCYGEAGEFGNKGFYGQKNGRGIFQAVFKIREIIKTAKS